MIRDERMIRVERPPAGGQRRLAGRPVSLGTCARKQAAGSPAGQAGQPFNLAARRGLGPLHAGQRWLSVGGMV